MGGERLPLPARIEELEAKLAARREEHKRWKRSYDKELNDARDFARDKSAENVRLRAEAENLRLHNIKLKAEVEELKGAFEA